MTFVKNQHADGAESEPLSLQRGISIYMKTDEESRLVHNIMARHMGFAEGSVYDAKIPSENSEYKYRVSIDLSRPTINQPQWLAAGGRIKSPTSFLAEVREKVPTAHIETLPGLLYARQL
jgi:hypothetical protein